MREALGEIEQAVSEGIVLDTTGSVVYTRDDICRRLKRLTTVVYLEASLGEEEILIARYLSDPKPVLWGDQFSRRPGESGAAAITRCYPALIAQRKRLYERYAHRIIPMARLRDATLDARAFLELVEAQVPHAQ
jgi:shikimate kinase